MPDRVQIGLRVSDLTRQKLIELSKREGRSVNNLIERIISLYIEDYERQHGEIEPSEL